MSDSYSDWCYEQRVNAEEEHQKKLAAKIAKSKKFLEEKKAQIASARSITTLSFVKCCQTCHNRDKISGKADKFCCTKLGFSEVNPLCVCQHWKADPHLWAFEDYNDEFLLSLNHSGPL